MNTAVKIIIAAVTAADNALRRFLLWGIGGYQKFISPLFAPRCRFYPSCSQYAKMVLQRCHSGRALRLIIWRLARCHPLSRGGEDLPPER